MPKKITDVSRKIIEAAMHIYHEEGFEKISMRRVAQISGLAVGTVYNRFEDKEDLLAQVLAGDIEQLKNIMMENVFGKSPEEALYALIESFIGRMMDESNNIIKYIADLQSQRDYIQKILRGACNRVNELIQEIIEKVYAYRGVALSEDQAAFITELTMSMIQSASQYGFGDSAMRADVVYGMVVAYAERKRAVEVLERDGSMSAV